MSLVQSMNQAFYFIEGLDINNIDVNLSENIWLLSYCNKQFTGGRKWLGSYTDIPAFGYDGTDETIGYCEEGDVVSFTVYNEATDEESKLYGDNLTWSYNEIVMAGILTDIDPIPNNYNLTSIYPNPFNPTTTINFAIPTDSEVFISVYNLQGREVVTLAHGSYDAGYHQVIWNADTHSSGVYFVKMVAGEFISTQKLMLVK